MYVNIGHGANVCRNVMFGEWATQDLLKVKLELAQIVGTLEKVSSSSCYCTRSAHARFAVVRSGAFRVSVLQGSIPKAD